MWGSQQLALLTAPGAQVVLSACPARFVSWLDPDFRDERPEESGTIPQDRSLADANLRGLSLADHQIKLTQVAATHADFMGGEEDHTVGLILGQFHAKQERIRQRDLLPVGLQPEADRRDLLGDQATRIARLVLAGKLGLESAHRRIRIPWAGVSEWR